MAIYYSYSIEALENIKLKSSHVQSDYERTKDFISGSVLRGAYIGKYIRKKGIKDINTIGHREQLLLGGIKFLNSYPEFNGSRSEAYPLCYYAEKEKMRSNPDSYTIKNGLLGNLEEGYKLSKGSFCNIKDGVITPVSVEKVENLHLNQRKDNSDENILFRYESILKGQKFMGYIKIEDEKYLKDLKSLMSDTTLILGGSKSSGYGKCKFKLLEKFNVNPESRYNMNSKDIKGDFYIVALSDIIFRDKYGVYKSHITEEFLNEKFRVSGIELKDSNIELTRIVNYNAKWKSFTSEVKAIAKGSVFRFTTDEKIDKAKISELIDKGIGEKLSDGYGRIDIRTELNETEVRKPISDGNGVTSKNIENSSDIHLSRKENKQLNKIYRNLYEQMIDSAMNKKILNISKKMDKLKMNNAQIGRYMGLFNTMQLKGKSKGIELFNEFIEHENRKRNKIKSLENTVIIRNNKSTSLLDELVAYVDSSGEKEKFIERYDIEKLQYRDLNDVITDEYVYDFNLKFLIELCKYHLRINDNEDRRVD